MRLRIKSHYSARLRLFPIVFFLAYLSITILLFAFGPWPYPISDGTKLYIFLTLAHLALLGGYVSGYRQRPGIYTGPWPIKRLINISISANLLFFIPTALVRTGSGIPNVIGGLNNPGAAYALAQSLQGGGPFIVVEYARILFGPLLALAMPLTIFYWQYLSKKTRLLGSLAIVSFLSIYLAAGTNKIFADYMVLIPWIAFASYRAGYLKLRAGKKLLFSVVVLCTFAAFFWFFSAGQQMRYGSGAVSGYLAPTRTLANPDNILVRPFSGQARTFIYSLCSYLTQGYYGLYLSLNEPFIPMFGIGNSMFLYMNVVKLTGDDEIRHLPYPTRLEKYGWDAYGKWSTIYPWIASDLSFPGTLLAVFLVGRLLALAWIDSLAGHNPFAIVALTQFIVMLFYFPANNQILQSGESFTSFFFIIGAWLCTRKKKLKIGFGQNGHGFTAN